MDKIKVLFADLYRLSARMKGEMKLIGRANELLSLAGDDKQASEIAGEIIEYASKVQTIAQAMIDNANDFLK